MAKYLFEVSVEKGCPCMDGDCSGDAETQFLIESGSLQAAWHEALYHILPEELEGVLSQMDDPQTTIKITAKNWGKNEEHNH